MKTIKVQGLLKLTILWQFTIIRSVAGETLVVNWTPHRIVLPKTIVCNALFQGENTLESFFYRRQMFTFPCAGQLSF